MALDIPGISDPDRAETRPVAGRSLPGIACAAPTASPRAGDTARAT